MMFENRGIKTILESDVIAIYGAGLMGKTLYKCLCSDTYKKEVNSFIVHDKDGNPDSIEGIQVIDIEHAVLYQNKLVLVALHEKQLFLAISELTKRGFTSLLPVSFDSDLWTDLRGNWMAYEKIGFDENTPIIKSIGNESSVYVVHSNVDKKLKENIIDKDFEKSILVGAELTDSDDYKYKDNTGENISERNKEFCELTALYWIWKNDNSKYVGLSHYRRKFLFDQVKTEVGIQDVDVVVTVPIINLNTVRGQYSLDHNIDDWDIMLEAIMELYPEYYETADQIQNGCYYYAYNMCIAKKEIMDEYCKWLFSILTYCDKKIEKNADNYQRRYAGFLAERLMTIYFVHNKQYKIGIAQKQFIQGED